MGKRGRPRKTGPREPSGRASRMSKADIEANMSTAISARVRHNGITPDAAKLPWMGFKSGLAIANEPDVVELWGRIEEICKRRRAWLHVIGQDEFAAISSIKPVTDHTTSIDQPPAYDLRDEAEKERGAQAAWDAVASALFAENPLLLRYVELAIVQDQIVKGPPIAQVLRLPALKLALGC